MSKPFFLFSPVHTVFDSSGVVVSSGAQIFTYQAGTSTKLTTYPTKADAEAGTNANANPLVADSAGRVGAIWATQAMKVVVAPSTDTDPPVSSYYSRDNIVSSGPIITSKTVTSTPYSVTTSDREMLVKVDASGGNKVVNLLAVATAGDGFLIHIVKSDSTANTVTINPNGSELINNSNSGIVLSSMGDMLVIICDGTQWFKKENSAISSLAVSGNVTIGGTLGVTGTTTLATVNTTQTNTDNLRLDGNTLSTTNTNGNLTLSPNGTGEVLKPTQCFFHARGSAGASNVTGDGTAYQLILDTKVSDIQTNYNASTGVFTAPVTGVYVLRTVVALQELAAGHTSGLVEITAGGVDYPIYKGNIGAARDAGNLVTVAGAIIVALTAAQTATVTIQVSGGAKVVDTVGGAGFTTFSGYLLG